MSFPEQHNRDDNVAVLEVVGKTIEHMRVYEMSDGSHEVGLWFTDGTQMTVEIESRTQINLKHLSRPKDDPDRITAQMDILHARAR